MSVFVSVRELARVTLLGASRNRLLLISVLFAVLLVALSVGAASVSFGERARLILDVGTAGASIIGSIVAVALTVSSIASDLRSRTAYTVLVRPVSRGAFVLGKYLGILAALVGVTTVMQLATALMVLLFDEAIPHAFWAGLWLNWVEMAVAAATAMLFCTLSSPVVASTLAGGTLVVGHLAQDAVEIAEKSKDVSELAVRALEIALNIAPDMQALSVRVQIANDLEVPVFFLGFATLYGVAYAGAMIALATFVFSRRRAV